MKCKHGVDIKSNSVCKYAAQNYKMKIAELNSFGKYEISILEVSIIF